MRNAQLRKLTAGYVLTSKREGQRGETSGRTHSTVLQHALHAQCMHACVHTRSHPANRTSVDSQTLIFFLCFLGT